MSQPQVIDYTKYIHSSPQEIQVQTFRGQGLPTNWSWDMWTLASGKPDPRTHTNNGTPIEEQQGEAYPTSTTQTIGPGQECNLQLPGAVSIIDLKGAQAFAHWAALGGQYHGLLEYQLDGGSWQVTGAYGSIPLSAGNHTLQLREVTPHAEPLVLRIGAVDPDEGTA